MPMLKVLLRPSTGLVLLSLVSLLSACSWLPARFVKAPPALVLQAPLQANYQPLQYKFEQDVFIRFDDAYGRMLRKGSQWQQVGRIKEGQVYAPVSGNFEIEGPQLRPAQLLMRDGYLVGFYLPQQNKLLHLHTRHVQNLWGEPKGWAGEQWHKVSGGGS